MFGVRSLDTGPRPRAMILLFRPGCPVSQMVFSSKAAVVVVIPMGDCLNVALKLLFFPSFSLRMKRDVMMSETPPPSLP